MKKFGKNKIALLLACASIFGGETQAMDTNKSQRHQTLAARGATDKNSNKGFANWAKDHKWQLAVDIGVPVVATASILAFLDIKYWGKKDIEDPWYTNNFEKVYEEIEEGCQEILKYVKNN